MRAPLDACMRIKGCLFVARKETKRQRSWHLVSPSVQRENHKCEARLTAKLAGFSSLKEERNQATAKLAGFLSLKEERNQATAKHTVQDQERKRKW